MPNEKDSLLVSSGSAATVSNGEWKGLFWRALTAFFTLTTAGLLIRVLTKPSSNDAQKPTSNERTKIRCGPEAVSAVYTATQFISFTISTMGGLVDAGECEGLVVDEATGSCYLGDAINITADLEHRLQIVANVIRTLRTDVFKENSSIDHADHVLKIVMFPEFFTRGPDGGEYDALATLHNCRYLAGTRTDWLLTLLASLLDGTATTRWIVD
jgi:hypothetical protein